MQSVRIIEIPAMRAAYSGPLTSGEAFGAFAGWFTRRQASLRGELFPRDFMRYNERLGAREWFYALPDGDADAGGFEIATLPHGLFAVASCLDADLDRAEDWLRTREELIAWVRADGRFKIHENGPDAEERYPMFHIVSPARLAARGISIEDLYMPIEEN